MDDLEIKIDTDGNLRSIYKDELMGLYMTLGTPTVSRASDVEWEDNHGWTVRCHDKPERALRFAKDKACAIIVSTEGQIVYFSNREAALREEVAHFWELIGETHNG